jgi:hypothetical protein
MTEVFRGFPQSILQMPEFYHKLGYDRFLAHPFQLIIQLSPFHSTLYSLSY